MAKAPAISPAVRKPFWPIMAQNKVLGAASAARTNAAPGRISRTHTTIAAKPNAIQAIQAGT